MERTLVILNPCTIQRGLIGEIISRFEKKGLRLVGTKMIWLTDDILKEHYAPFRDFEAKGVADSHLISYERSDELAAAVVLDAADGLHPLENGRH